MTHQPAITDTSRSTALQPLAARINAAHDNACASVRAGLDYARQAGDALIEVKQRLTHGAFLPWVAEHTNLGARTAQGYMRLAREWPRLVASEDAQRVADLPLRGALALLAERPAARATDPRLAAEQLSIEVVTLHGSLAALAHALEAPGLTLAEAAAIERRAGELETAVRALLEETAADKGYHAGGLTGPNPMYEFVAETAGGPGHALGEIIYKARRYAARRDPADLVKIAAWAYLVWRFDHPDTRHPGGGGR